MTTEIKQLAQDILAIRKQEFGVRTSLAALGLDTSAANALFDLMGAAYEVGWDDHHAQARKAPTPAKASTQPEKAIATADAKRKRLPIREALQKVIGNKTLSIDMIMEGLKEQSWTPTTIKPRANVTHTLCVNKGIFESVTDRPGRGWYRLVSTGKSSSPVQRKTLKGATTTQERCEALKVAINKHFPKGGFTATELAHKVNDPQPSRLSSLLYRLRKENVIHIIAPPTGNSGCTWAKH